MCIVLVVAVFLKWVVSAPRNQRLNVLAIQTFDEHAGISYRDADRVSSRALLKLGAWLSWTPMDLERSLGKDYFQTVESVSMVDRSRSDEQIRHEALTALARLPGIRTLDLRFPVDDSDVACFGNMRSLQRLDLHKDCPELTDASLQVLSRSTSITTLTINGASISDSGFVYLGRMARLQELRLVQPYRPAARQEHGSITGTGFAHLDGLKHLRLLEIHSAFTKAEGLKHVGMLTSLQHLRLYGGVYDDDALRYLATLANLQTLTIVNSNVTGTGFEALAQLSNLSGVYLGGPSVNDAAILHIAKLPSLTSILLAGTQVTAAGLEDFRNAPRLNCIELAPYLTSDRLEQTLPGCRIQNGGQPLEVSPAMHAR